MPCFPCIVLWPRWTHGHAGGHPGRAPGLRAHLKSSPPLLPTHFLASDLQKSSLFSSAEDVYQRKTNDTHKNAHFSARGHPTYSKMRTQWKQRAFKYYSLLQIFCTLNNAYSVLLSGTDRPTVEGKPENMATLGTYLIIQTGLFLSDPGSGQTQVTKLRQRIPSRLRVCQHEPITQCPSCTGQQPLWLYDAQKVWRRKVVEGLYVQRFFL